MSKMDFLRQLFFDKIDFHCGGSVATAAKGSAPFRRCHTLWCHHWNSVPTDVVKRGRLWFFARTLMLNYGPSAVGGSRVVKPTRLHDESRA